MEGAVRGIILVRGIRMRERTTSVPILESDGAHAPYYTYDFL
jgi:hypothetical protein